MLGRGIMQSPNRSNLVLCFALLGLATAWAISLSFASAQTPEDIATEILFRSIPVVDGVAQSDEPRIMRWDHAPLLVYLSLDPSEPADPAPLNAMLQRYFDDIQPQTRLSFAYVADQAKADIWINYKNALGLKAYVKKIEQVEGVVCFGTLFHRGEMAGDAMAPNWGVVAVPSDLGNDFAEACLAETLTKVLGYSRQPRAVFGFDQTSLDTVKPLGDFDRLVLRLLYTPRAKSGMTKNELRRAIGGG